VLLLPAAKAKGRDHGQRARAESEAEEPANQEADLKAQPGQIGGDEVEPQAPEAWGGRRRRCLRRRVYFIEVLEQTARVARLIVPTIIYK
jgi:hypothetical protein